MILVLDLGFNSSSERHFFHRCQMTSSSKFRVPFSGSKEVKLDLDFLGVDNSDLSARFQGTPGDQSIDFCSGVAIQKNETNIWDVKFLSSFRKLGHLTKNMLYSQVTVLSCLQIIVFRRFSIKDDLFLIDPHL